MDARACLPVLCAPRTTVKPERMLKRHVCLLRLWFPGAKVAVHYFALGTRTLGNRHRPSSRPSSVPWLCVPDCAGGRLEVRAQAPVTSLPALGTQPHSHRCTALEEEIANLNWCSASDSKGFTFAGFGSIYSQAIEGHNRETQSCMSAVRLLARGVTVHTSHHDASLGRQNSCYWWCPPGPLPACE